MESPSEDPAERLAREFHGTLERLAPGYDSQSPRWRHVVPWESMSVSNRSLLIAVHRELLDKGVIEAL